MYQQNPYGAKSISLFQDLYTRLAGPLGPYLQTPYSLLAPYLQQADALGASALDTADEKFPAIKQADMKQLQGHAIHAARVPLQLVGAGSNYLFETYSSEKQKCGGGSDIITIGKSIICTELRIVSDAMVKLHEYLNVDTRKAQQTTEKVKKTGVDKAEEAKGAVQKKVDQATK